MYKWLTGALEFPQEYETGPNKLAPKLREYMKEVRNFKGGVGEQDKGEDL